MAAGGLGVLVLPCLGLSCFVFVLREKLGFTASGLECISPLGLGIGGCWCGGGCWKVFWSFFLFSLNFEGKGSLESFIFEYSEKEQPSGARARKSPLCL